MNSSISSINDMFKSLKERSISEFSNGRGVIVKEVFADSFNYMKSGTLHNIAREIAMVPILKQIESRYVLDVLSSPYIQKRAYWEIRKEKTYNGF